MAQISEARRSYLREYRKKNKERLNELNRQGYQRRKHTGELALEQNKNLIELIRQNKQKKLQTMDESRKRRRMRVQSRIYSELSNLNQ